MATLAARTDRWPGWWARWALRRFVARPSTRRMATLLRRVRRGPQPQLEALCEALAREHPRLFATGCAPQLSAAVIDSLVPVLGADLLLIPRAAGCAVVMRTDRGEQVFRGLPTAVRRTFAEVRPWRLDVGMRCPVCDGDDLRFPRNTATGRELVDHSCNGCSWLFTLDRGPSLSTLLLEEHVHVAGADDEATRPWSTEPRVYVWTGEGFRGAAPDEL